MVTTKSISCSEKPTGIHPKRQSWLSDPSLLVPPKTYKRTVVIKKDQPKRPAAKKSQHGPPAGTPRRSLPQPVTKATTKKHEPASRVTKRALTSTVKSPQNNAVSTKRAGPTPATSTNPNLAKGSTPEETVRERYRQLAAERENSMPEILPLDKSKLVTRKRTGLKWSGGAMRRCTQYDSYMKLDKGITWDIPRIARKART